MKTIRYTLGSTGLKVRLADTFALRLRGLLGRRLSDGEGLLLTPCRQIHTMLMAYPIDVVYIGDGRVVRIAENIAPNRFLAAVKGARAVLELPSGAVAAHNINVGDTAYEG